MGEIIAFLYKWEIFRKDDKYICVREELLQKFPWVGKRVGIQGVSGGIKFF